MRWLPAAVAVSAIVPVACGDRHVDCGAPVEWTTFEDEVSSMSTIVTGSDGDQKATVVLSSGRELIVWGEPDRLAIGSAYRFEVTQDGEAFVGFDRDVACIDGAVRQVVNADGTPVG